MSAQRSRGMTLIEAVIALLVLATGLAALLTMINHIQEANRRMAFQTNALNVFRRVSAQIRDARCEFDPANPGFLVPAMTDPGFSPQGVWQYGANGLSNISLIGTMDGQTPGLPHTVPVLNVAYRVSLEGMLAMGPADAPAFDVDVAIREVTNDPLRDNPALLDGYWIQVFPVKKVCNPRVDATSRGYP